MQIMGTLDKPTSGDISVNEQNISKLSDSDLSSFRNQTIGFVFQQFYLQPYLTISQNVEVPLIFGKMDKNMRQEKVGDALKAVGLENRAKHLPSQISGGQMQRVAIARAVVTKPKIILADEPTGNLDSGNRKEVLELFKKINKEFGTTVVIITHDEEIAKQADRIIKLSDGRIVE
jgi:ABC-type lipoprotein export system ATPase subunit